VESRLEPIAVTAEDGKEVDVEMFIKVLDIVPRVGLSILILIVLSMMIAARGS